MKDVYDDITMAIRASVASKECKTQVQESRGVGYVPMALSVCVFNHQFLCEKIVGSLCDWVPDVTWMFRVAWLC